MNKGRSRSTIALAKLLEAQTPVTDIEQVATREATPIASFPPSFLPGERQLSSLAYPMDVQCPMRDKVTCVDGRLHCSFDVF